MYYCVKDRNHHHNTDNTDNTNNRATPMSKKPLYYEWNEAMAAFMKHMKKYADDYYVIEVVLNREPENIIIHKDDIEEIVEETISAHPMCPLYAEARKRLLTEISTNSRRYPNLDWNKFDSVITRMLDLSKPADMNIMKELRDLGYNPTMNLDTEDMTRGRGAKGGGRNTRPSRFYFNILLHKQWKAKRDANKTKDVIIREIYDDLLHGDKPFHTNRYLPSMIALYGWKESECV
jgi:hypothetical protein